MYTCMYIHIYMYIYETPVYQIHGVGFGASYPVGGMPFESNNNNAWNRRTIEAPAEDSPTMVSRIQ